MNDALHVLFEDAHLIAVVKPAGLLTQAPASKAAPTLEAAVRRHLALAPDSHAATYLGTIHRLDRPVSGLVLWAKTPKAARRVSGQFMRRTVEKEYAAALEPLAAGAASEIEGVWDDWLGESSDASGVVRRLEPGAPGGRRALTRFGRVGDGPGGVLYFHLWPETGRTHQLRAQAAARGMPVVGDAPYGSTRPFRDGIALHARALSFTHPATSQRMTILAPWPESWTEAGFAFPDARK